MRQPNLANYIGVRDTASLLVHEHLVVFTAAMSRYEDKPDWHRSRPIRRRILLAVSSLSCYQNVARVRRRRRELLRQNVVNGSTRRINKSDVVRRIELLFPPAVWNVHDLILSDGDRTNNFAEPWNRRFETLVGHNNPTIWKTIIEVLGADA